MFNKPRPTFHLKPTGHIPELTRVDGDRAARVYLDQKYDKPTSGSFKHALGVIILILLAFFSGYVVGGGLG